MALESVPREKVSTATHTGTSFSQAEPVPIASLRYLLTKGSFDRTQCKGCSRSNFGLLDSVH